MTKRRSSEYAKALAVADAKIQDADRYRCQYAIDGIRCSAPGTICDATSGPGKGEEDYRRWLCLAHYQLRDDPLGSREVLADLATYSPKHPEDWRARMLEDASLGELQQAWRDIGEDQKQKLIAATIRKAKTFVRPIVSRPKPTGGDRAVDVGAQRQQQLDAAYRAMTPEERVEYDRGAA